MLFEDEIFCFETEGWICNVRREELLNKTKNVVHEQKYIWIIAITPNVSKPNLT